MSYWEAGGDRTTSVNQRTVRRVIVRNKEGILLHDWRSAIVSKGHGRVMSVENQGFWSRETYVPSTSDSIQIFE